MPATMNDRPTSQIFGLAEVVVGRQIDHRERRRGDQHRRHDEPPARQRHGPPAGPGHDAGQQPEENDQERRGRRHVHPCCEEQREWHPISQPRSQPRRRRSGARPKRGALPGARHSQVTVTRDPGAHVRTAGWVASDATQPAVRIREERHGVPATRHLPTVCQSLVSVTQASRPYQAAGSPGSAS